MLFLIEYLIFSVSLLTKTYAMPKSPTRKIFSVLSARIGRCVKDARFVLRLKTSELERVSYIMFIVGYLEILIILAGKEHGSQNFQFTFLNTPLINSSIKKLCTDYLMEMWKHNQYRINEFLMNSNLHIAHETSTKNHFIFSYLSLGTIFFL